MDESKPPLALTAVTALARALHKKNVLQMGNFLKELESDAIAMEEKEQESEAAEVFNYMSGLKAITPRRQGGTW